VFKTDTPGTVFSMTLNAEFTVLHRFTGGGEGTYAIGPLLQASDGRFYGTTPNGGISDFGTIFTIDGNGAFSVLYKFHGNAEGWPVTTLLQASDGNFYGTAYFGGYYNRGTVFRMSPAGAVTVLHTFSGGFDGGFPDALIQAGDGNLYGATWGNGQFDAGVLFTLTLGGTFTTLHAFNRDDGNRPTTLIQATDGNFYGTTYFGGPSDVGTLFQMTANGQVTVLHAFTPVGPRYVTALVKGSDGSLYGFGSLGVFRSTLGGSVTTLCCFGADMFFSGTTLVQGFDGNLYGASFCAELFRLSLTGAFTNLSPGIKCGGSSSSVRLFTARSGTIYGSGGSFGIFTLAPSGATTLLSDRFFAAPSLNRSHGRQPVRRGRFFLLSAEHVRAVASVGGGCFTERHRKRAADMGAGRRRDQLHDRAPRQWDFDHGRKRCDRDECDRHNAAHRRRGCLIRRHRGECARRRLAIRAGGLAVGVGEFAHTDGDGAAGL
jgi:uncharacterized repeat protein (TIGR03803 family)